MEVVTTVAPVMKDLCILGEMQRHTATIHVNMSSPWWLTGRAVAYPKQSLIFKSRLVTHMLRENQRS